MDDAFLREAELARDQLSRLEGETGRRRLEFHQAVRRLHSAGPSMRDIASALGLSHQRVHQIISGDMNMTSPSGRGTLIKRLVGGRRRRQCEPGRGPQPLQELIGRRFHEDARAAMIAAEAEARALGHGFLGTEHLLLGLLSTEPGTAARLLRAAGADLDRSRALIQALIGTPPPQPRDDQLSPTGRVKSVLELARSEARALRSPHIRSEHLLLGVAREGRGLGARVLTESGISYEQIRARAGRAGLACTFCGRSGLDVAHLVAGPGVFICDRCIEATGSRPGPQAAARRSQSVPAVAAGNDAGALCSFCGRPAPGIVGLVKAGGGPAICPDCLQLCREIEDEERESQHPGRG